MNTSIPKPRVALIGPVIPFRSGIAQHTTMLHRELRNHVDLKTISFNRQYPKWLFPGQSDRDPQYNGQAEPDVHYLIDSLNPLTWRTALRETLRHQPDVVVIPWWSVYWTPCFRYLAAGIQKAGIKLIFLCHNVVDHERAPWKLALTRSVLRYGSRLLVQSREGQRQLNELFPDTPTNFHPHPLYDQYPSPRGSLERRAAIELLFFGIIRPYKGLDLLLNALALLKHCDVHLSVVGEFWSGRRDIERQIGDLELAEHVELVPRYVSQQEAAEYFQRADMVVLPYRSATGTGVIPLAYHYDKPVIVTNVGGLPDVVEHQETGFVLASSDPQSIASAIHWMHQADVQRLASSINRYKRRLSWTSLVHILVGPEIWTHRAEQPCPYAASRS